MKLKTHLYFFTAFISLISSANNLSTEEQRLYTANKAIPEVVTAFDKLVEDFRRDISRIKTKTQISYFIHIHANQLWQDAKRQARTTVDDRALYWARLKLQVILRQSEHFQNMEPETQDELIEQLNTISRGGYDLFFNKSKAQQRILITGFDPFNLDRNIYHSNPSGAIALALDGKTIEVDGISTDIEAIIFPVRYQDFDQGLVEKLLTEKLYNTVDAIVTVSQGGKPDFRPEQFAGLRRSTDLGADNQGVIKGHRSNPEIPLLNGRSLSSPEFLESSLPLDAILKESTCVSVKLNTIPITVTIASGDQSGKVLTPKDYYSFKTLRELNAKLNLIAKKYDGLVVSSMGNGGGFLSNEISYRSLRLRDLYNPDLPIGHIHTPPQKTYDNNSTPNIVKDFEKVLHALIKSIRQ